MDDNYQNYINRVAPTILPKAHQYQLANIRQSAKFDSGKPVSFPGYTVMTPTSEDDRENYNFYHQLELLQQQLLATVSPDLIALVPPSTFHVTIADLIWDNDYRDAVKKNPQFPNQLQDTITHSFQEYKSAFSPSKPLKFRLLGLTVFPRAVIVSLIPDCEEDYNQIISLRRCIYQNPSLMALGIEQQYNFTAHVTLGYFEKIPTEVEQESLVSILDDLNQQWLEKESPILMIKKVELRKFEDMITYILEQNYPSITWGIN